MGADEQADRVVLEADAATARRGPPHPGGNRRRQPRRQLLHLPHRDGGAVDRHGRHVRRTVRVRLRARLGRQASRRPGSVERARQQVALRDLELLVLAVARQLDQREPRPHRLGDRVGRGRRREPQDTGQIERRIDVLVPERGPVLEVEDIEQRVGGLGVHPVDRLEDEDRVANAGLAQSLDDAPGGAWPATEQALEVRPVQRQAHVGAAERAGDGQSQRRLAGPRGAGQAGDGRRPRAHDQRGCARAAAARAFDGERAMDLRARRQHLDEARLGLLEPAVRAVQRPRHSRRVEPLPRAPAPRQRDDLPRALHRVVERALLGCECLRELVAQRLEDRAEQIGAPERSEQMVEARAGREGCAPGVERGAADRRVPQLAVRLGAGAGQRFVCARGPVGAVPEQSEHLGLVHQRRSAGGRQVGESPPLALRRGGNDVGRVRGPPFRRAAAAGQGGPTAESLERLVVLVARVGIDEQHAGAVVPLEQLHAHPAKSLSMAPRSARAGPTRSRRRRSAAAGASANSASALGLRRSLQTLPRLPRPPDIAKLAPPRVQ